jgi:hypothetical protein
MTQEKVAPQAKPVKKVRDTSRLGQSRIFTPEVIDDIHIKSELGRYRMRGFSLFKKIPHWDDLTFLPGTLTRFVIEFYRGDAGRGLYFQEAVSISQIISIVLIPLSLAMLWYLSWTSSPKRDLAVAQKVA